MGADGETGESLDEPEGGDDVIPADNGSYLGLARSYVVLTSFSDG